MPGITNPRKPRDTGRTVEAGPVNAALAAEARRRFAAAPVGSLPRKAAGVVSVTLSTTRSTAAARKAIETAQLAEIVRVAALNLLDELDAGAAGEGGE